MWSCKRKRLKPGPYSSSSFSSGLGTRLHTAILNEDPPCPPLAFSKWSQTSRQPAIAEGSKRLSMPLVTCHMFTSLRKSLVSWATILVTWGEIAPPFKSSNHNCRMQYNDHILNYNDHCFTSYFHQAFANHSVHHPAAVPSESWM